MITARRHNYVFKTMKTIKQATITPKYSEFIPDAKSMLPGIIYVSREYSTASHKCLCGCGGLTITPLDKPYGWTLTENEKGITMTPSILNSSFECKSHYIITNGIANFV